MKKKHPKKHNSPNFSTSEFIKDASSINKLGFFVLFFCFVVLVFAPFVPWGGAVKQKPSDSLDLFPTPEVSVTTALYPKKKADASTIPLLSAKSAIVIDVDSQVVVYSQNEEEFYKPASTTKMMTALVGIETYNPQQILTVKTYPVEGSDMGLVKGEQITFENLLYGMLLNSGNDAAVAIADNYPGGYAAFINRMNEKAKELHLNHTHFQNPDGLEDPNHYSSAIDLARLASIALKNKLFAKVVSTEYKTATDITGTYVHPLHNLNKLLGEFQGTIGVKTGFTEEAGQVLVAAATRQGHTLVSVVMKSDDRFADSEALLNWAFASFSYVQVNPTIMY